MVDEAVILCGGLGTRLRSVVTDVPKPLAPIACQPFLKYLLEALQRDGVRRAILSVGCMAEAIVDRFGSRWNGLDIDCAREPAPAGTGGGLKLGTARVGGLAAFGLNGDSFLAASLRPLEAAPDASMAMGVRRERNTGRYGVCRLDAGRVVGFQPGRPGEPGWINAGAYLLPRDLLAGEPDAPFSFERDSVEARADALRPAAVCFEAPFIDIGVPESYAFTQTFNPLTGDAA